jgi:1,4-dihydroxy-2-naphthoate polyprenyltransferase
MIKLLRLARPHFLLASLVLFTMGAAWAIILGAEPGFWKLIWGFLVVFCAQLSVSFSNDYFDAETDRFGDPSLFAGGSGILVRYPELKALAKRAALVCILLSLALGLFFTIHYSYPVWFFGLILIGNLLGWYYAAPPIRLAYRGLGEISTSIAAGVFLPGMGYMAATGVLDGNGMAIMIPLLLIGLAFILSVEIPDMEADRLGGKRTWVARRGRSFGFWVVGILLLAVAGYFYLVPALIANPPPINFWILGLFSLLPLCAGWIGIIKRPEGKQESTLIVNAIIGGMIAFFVFSDTYLLYLAIQ